MTMYASARSESVISSFVLKSPLPLYCFFTASNSGWIRLRMAIHAGEVHHDKHGVAATAINVAFRLLEAEVLKCELARTAGVLAVIASQWFYDEVIRHTPISRPEDYCRVRISVKETEGPKFAAALEAHVRAYEVDVINNQRVEALEPAPQPGGYATVRLANGAELKGRSIVLATGARWRPVNVPGEADYKTRGVAYCPHCDGPLFKGKRVAVIGGGNSGAEAAIDLAGIVEHVTLLEFADQLKADAVLVAKLRSLRNVDVHTGAQTTEIVGDGQKVTGLRYKSRSTGDEHLVDVAGVFVQIGLVPNTDWLKGTVELSRHGEIVVDARGATSLPGVFAAGDVTTVPYKQIIVASGEGSKAALSAFDHLIRSSAPAQ